MIKIKLKSIKIEDILEKLVEKNAASANLQHKFFKNSKKIITKKGEKNEE